MESDITALYHISPDRIRDAMPVRGGSLRLYCYDSIDSTNDEAKRLFRNGITETALVAADSQSAGRGRLGRSFYSPSETGVYFSLLYPLSPGRIDFLSATSKAAVAVCRCLSGLFPVHPRIKWVNDILLGGKKVCGILAEYVSMPGRPDVSCVVIGIGINLSTESFPDGLSDTAGSVGHFEVPRETVIARTSEELLSLLDDSGPDYLGEYRALSAVLGRSVSFVKNGTEAEGTAVGIDDSAALIVLLPDGSEAVLNSGEISVRIF